MKATMMQGFAAALLAGTLLLAGCGGGQASTTQTTETKSTEKTEQTQPAEKTEQTQTQKSTTDDQTSKQQSTQETTQTQTQTKTESATSETTPAAPTASSSQGNYIGEAAAKAAALADAGLAESDVTELKCKLDTDEAVVHYDVDFKHGGLEYDYDVDPVTGAVIKHSSEVDD